MKPTLEGMGSSDDINSSLIDPMTMTQSIKPASGNIPTENDQAQLELGVTDANSKNYVNKIATKKNS